MLLLKTLEIIGFKSFAKKTVLDFTAPISAIVGPNGSGKSNVAESFRFVLGEQSIKSLRGKKGEDLIFNGASEGGKLNRASVRLTFDNTSKFLPIDFSEVVIERVVHRDSVNEYLINGSVVRLKDIQELLASANIGSTGHHIISQGEADKILNANEQERREMVEDALGLKIYQYKKEESEKKLDKVKENIEKVESLRRELAPHIRFLKKQVEKIEKAKLLREDLVASYQQYLKRENLYLKHEKEKVAAQITPIHTKIEELDQQQKQAEAILQSEQLGSGQNDGLKIWQARLTELRDERNQVLRETGEIDGEIRSILRLIEREQQQIVADDNRSVKVKEVEKMLEAARKILQETAQEPAKIIETLAKLNALFDQFLQINHSQETNLPQYEQDIAELRVKQQSFEERLTGLKDSEDKILAEISAEQTKLENSKNGLVEAEKKVLIITAEQNSLRAELSAWQAKWQQLLDDEQNYQKELNEAMVLAGRVALDYDNQVVDGWEVEPRQTQRERAHNLEKLKIRLEEMGGVNSGIEKEFTEATERDNFLTNEVNDLSNSSATLQQLIAELNEKIEAEFKIGLEKINLSFAEFFKQMFGGGSAELSLVKTAIKRKKNIDDLDELITDDQEETESGIDIKISHPFKKIKSLMMMSGGERSLTSIALLFAISQVNPPPFIILDETDAALDEANSKKYGNMISALAKYSQLILITHNRETMSRAGVLYGVTMSSGGASKLLSIKFDEAVAVAK